MSSRQLQRARLRKVPIGDMRTPVVIREFEITAPTVGVDFGRHITPNSIKWRCKVTTVSGVTMFDSSNVEQVITHDFQGRFVKGISRDMMVEYDGRYFKIISAENMEERSQFLRLRCTERGSLNKAVNSA